MSAILFGSAKQIKPVLITAVGSVAPMALTLFTVPIYIRLISIERFGVLSIVWLILGYLTIFDFGFGRAVASYVAGSESEERRSEIIGTGLALSAITGLIGALALYSIAHLVHFPTAAHELFLDREISNSIFTLSILVPVSTAASVLYGALQGRSEFRKLAYSQNIDSALFQLLPLAMAYFGSTDLCYLTLAAAFGRIVGLLITAIFCFGFREEQAPVRFSLASVPRLLKFGGWTLASSAVNQALLTSDRFFTSSLLGLSSVAYYSIPYNLILRAVVFPYSWFVALYPLFSGSSEDEARTVFVTNTKTLSLVTLSASALGILLVGPFLKFWIGPDLKQQSHTVAIVLFAGYYFYSLSFIPLSFFQSRRRPKIPAIIYFCEFLLYIPLLWISITAFGLVGAAIAWSTRVFLDSLLLHLTAGFSRLYLVMVAIAVPALCLVSLAAIYFT
jgi:O-antigen/teichoic acid export membrane protein